MKIFAIGANSIVNIISQYKNNHINNKELNRNLLSTIIFNYYYFKKDSKKLKKEKEAQKQIYQNFLAQEEKQIKNERIYLSRERNKKRKEEIYQKFTNERKLMLDNYKEKKHFTSILEPTFDCYIPIKQFSIPLEFYTNKIVTKIFDQEETEIKGKEEIKYNEEEVEVKVENIKGLNDYKIDIPIHLCENNDIYFNEDSFSDMEKEEKNDVNNNNDLLDILKMDDKDLFYEDEKMDMKSQKTSIYNESNKIELPTKKVNTFEDIELDKNLTKNEIVENHFKEFSSYLPLSIYTKYIKQMNYIYLHLMLMDFFDLEHKINLLILHEDIIIVNHVKKCILESGICALPLYEKIVKNISTIKDKLTFEKYLDFFTPIFKASEEYQSYKYKFLLDLSRNKYSEKMTHLEFDMFLNLVKGKKIYDKETYSDLLKRFKVIYKKQYPKHNQKKYYLYRHVITVLEFIIDLNYKNLDD